MGLGITSDTLWLADFSPAQAGWRVCELGCGTGEISLRLARRVPVAVWGVDVAADMIDAARSRVSQERLCQGAAVSFEKLSIHEAPQNLGRFSFDLVVCNPPFFRSGAGRPSPDDSRRLAREELGVTLADVVAAAANLLKRRGEFCCILPPERLDEIMALGRTHQLPVTHIQPVYPVPEKTAKRVLIRSRKDSRAGLTILPPRIPAR